MKTPFLFDAVIGPDGSLRVPDGARASLAPHAGSTVRVRVLPAVLADALLARGVTDEEIDAIATRQLEGRDDVIRFLMAEGSAADTHRVLRAAGRR
jgi:hypothetical protein